MNKIRGKVNSHHIEKEIQKERPYISIDHSTYKNTKNKCLFIDEKYGSWWAWPRSVWKKNNEHPCRRVKYTPEEIEEIIKSTRPNLSLDKSTYVNNSVKARFIDSEFGEWWALPGSLIKRKKENHPRRSKFHNKYTSYDVEKEIQKERPYISIDHSTYKKLSVKARFIDSEFGEWWAQPASVLHLKTGNPKRYGNKTLSPKEVEEMVKRCIPELRLDYSSYINTHTRAKFIHKDFGEWIIRPNDLLNKKEKAVHPKFHQNKLLSPEEVEKRIQASVPYIKLDYSTYTNTALRARFIDDDYGEWWGLPYDLLKNPRGHPKRAGSYSPTEEEYINSITKNDKVKLVPGTFLGLSKKAKFIDRDYGYFTRIARDIIWGARHQSAGFSYTYENKIAEKLGIKWFSQEIPIIKKRPDLQITPTIYMEIDGLYWHSEHVKENTHHLKRRELFESVGLRLFQFRQDEIENKLEIIKSIINNVINKNELVYARKCNLVYHVKPEFFEENHLMGYSGSKSIGLEFNRTMVSALGYKIIGNELHIHRFCNAKNITCVGGLSRLIKKAVDLNKGVSKIVSFVDLRYGTGNSLKTLGFTQENVTLGWKWTDGRNTFNRLKCRANMDKRELTEREHAEELGWYKIYDAGQAKFVKKI
jgi:very-short-patch-repair endonuclease